MIEWRGTYLWSGDGFIYDLELLGLNVPNRSYDVNGLMHVLLET